MLQNTGLHCDGQECYQLDGMCLLSMCMQKCPEEKAAGWHVHRSEDLHACLSSVGAVIVIEYNQTFLCVSVASQTFTLEPLVPWQKKKDKTCIYSPRDMVFVPVSICFGLGKVLYCLLCLLLLRQDSFTGHENID